MGEDLGREISYWETVGRQLRLPSTRLEGDPDMHSKKVVCLRTAVGAIGLSIASLALVTGPANAAGPKVYVTPKTDLAKKATVKVWGRNLPPNQSVYVLECAVEGSFNFNSDCSTKRTGATIDGEGGLDTSLAVSKTFTTLSNAKFKCAATTQCEVAVMGLNDGDELFGNQVVISFR